MNILFSLLFFSLCIFYCVSSLVYGSDETLDYCISSILNHLSFTIFHNLSILFINLFSLDCGTSLLLPVINNIFSHYLLLLLIFSSLFGLEVGLVFDALITSLLQRLLIGYSIFYSLRKGFLDDCFSISSQLQELMILRFYGTYVSYSIIYFLSES
jgi:hypothetical protein